MDVCTIGILVFLCLLSTLKTVTSSVNTCRYPKVKLTTQSSNHSEKYPSSKAVDGCTKQIFVEPWCCSHTRSGHKEAWWQVDLEELIVIEYVKIYYRDQKSQKRFGGYQIYQSNTSDWRNGNCCYRDATPTAGDLLMAPKIRCTGTGQYLTIYSDRRSRGRSWYSIEAFLELCEVEVYGCPLGSFGNGTCESKCSTGCADSLCDPVTGECTSCIPGRYGSNCNEACQFKCKDNRCIQSNGTCEDCEDGFFGSSCARCSDGCTDPVCDKRSGECSPCIPGYYGSHCNQTCPFKCKDNRCIQSNGKCEDCDDGFFGSSCFGCSVGCSMRVCNKTSGACSPCTPGYFGNTCNIICPPNCKEKTCDQTSGLCTECGPGFYGTGCNQTCPDHCMNSLCTRTSGDCPECEPGFFGQSCNMSCSANCDKDGCQQNNGTCIECEPGFFGQSCNMPCSANCDKDGCQQNNGTCIACESGYFGLDCEKKCGQCIAVACNRSDGICLCSETTHMTCGCNKGWEGKNCTTEKVMSVPDDKTGTRVGVGVAVGIGILLLLLVVIAVVVIRKRKRSAKRKANHHDGSSSRTTGNVGFLPIPPGSPDKQDTNAGTRVHGRQLYVNLDNINRTTDDNVVYNNVNVTGVHIQELRSIIDRKMEDKAAAFKEEFQTFPWGAVHPHEAGKKPSNKQKNRFKTTFPYDHSRIVLDTEGQGVDASYINANYIDGIENEKMYIASQGPKQNTMDDFWRMVWQLNSGKIVMLTNLKEGRTDKCYKYWPDEGESLPTTTFELKLDRERCYAFYVIRDISITLKKTNEERQVHQFHFTTWPDHGTPDTSDLVLFDRRVTSYKTQLTGQMIVHCSAGIGRTGTFIGLDALLAHGKKTGKVDIPRYVGTMRNGRMNMIQTYEQYIALHESLVEGFNSPESLISRMNYPAVLEAMCPRNTSANQTKVHQEFKILQTLIPNYPPDCFKAALLTENREKNRNKNILAADKFRPFLKLHSPNMTDYINAVIIQSYTSKSGYLMTQFPLVNTIHDFWTMVFDYGCENIVVLGKPTEEEDWLREDVGDFASGNSISVKKLQDRSTSNGFATVDYQVESEQFGRETIRIFNMSQWSSNSLLPPSDSSLLQLLEQLDSRRRSDSARPVVVMCRDGCTQSGLFCCISNIRDQMKMDEEVDIFQTAKQLKKRRPEGIENIMQYQYCYNILGLYLDSTDVYIN